MRMRSVETHRPEAVQEFLGCGCLKSRQKYTLGEDFELKIMRMGVINQHKNSHSVPVVPFVSVANYYLAHAWAALDLLVFNYDRKCLPGDPCYGTHHCIWYSLQGDYCPCHRTHGTLHCLEHSYIESSNLIGQLEVSKSLSGR